MHRSALLAFLCLAVSPALAQDAPKRKSGKQ
jgi:hypothetical protein